MNMFKKLFELFKMKNNLKEPSIVKDSTGFYIKTHRGYKVKFDMCEEYIYFTFKYLIDYKFCIKRPADFSSVDAVKEIIKSTSLFSMNLSSFKSFIHKLICYTNFVLFDQIKKDCIIKFENNYYQLIEVNCKQFLKNVKKIVIKTKNNDVDFKIMKGYLFDGDCINLYNLDDYRNESYVFSADNYYGDSKEINVLINSISEKVDLTKFVVLRHRDVSLFLKRENNKRVLVGVTKKQINNVDNIKLKNLKPSARAISGYVLDDENLIKFKDFSTNELSDRSIIIYSNEKGKICRKKCNTTNDSVIKLQYSAFNKFENNYEMILKYPSERLIEKLIKHQIIKENEQINIDHLKLLEILDI